MVFFDVLNTIKLSIGPDDGMSPQAAKKETAISTEINKGGHILPLDFFLAFLAIPIHSVSLRDLAQQCFIICLGC